jgi:hypothetical protein
MDFNFKGNESIYFVEGENMFRKSGKRSKVKGKKR